MPQRRPESPDDLIPVMVALAVVLATQVILYQLAVSSGASYGISIGLGLATLWTLHARRSSDS